MGLIIFELVTFGRAFARFAVAGSLALAVLALAAPVAWAQVLPPGVVRLEPNPNPRGIVIVVPHVTVVPGPILTPILDTTRTEQSSSRRCRGRR